ncbi:Spy/CpxP family protein refolding chaperone [Methylomonas sp. 2BW1-5-20]|uniref:Spy/CpxP family protein refolding chaperone n=1 Tax=Methylomonas sp. 2BW1-5-20 TaxID=3376686 RepID=UPI00404D3997
MKKLVLILSLLPFAVAARPGHDEHCGGGKPPMHAFGEGHGEMQLPPYLKKLELSDKQEADIKGLLKAEFGDSRSRFDEDHALRAELHALSFSADYNEAKAKALLEKSVAIHQQLALEKSKIDNAIFLLLTAPQQAQLKAEIGKFEH